MTTTPVPPGDDAETTTIVATLAFASSASALFQTVLTPYVAFFVVDAGVCKDLASPGYYAAYLTSAEHVGRVATSYAWGRYSDLRGRAQVMEQALLVIAVGSLVLGWTLDFRVAVATRFLMGCFDSTWSMCKAYAGSQFRDAPRAQARAMASLGASYGLAMLVGPAMGGLLARPAEEYPALGLRETSLLARRPYLLPNVMCALFATVAWTATRRVLRDREKLPMKAPPHGVVKEVVVPEQQQQQREAATDEEDGADEEVARGWLSGLWPSRRRRRERAGTALLVHSTAANARTTGSSPDYEAIVHTTTSCIEEPTEQQQQPPSLAPLPLCAGATALATAFYSLISVVEFSEDLVFPLWAAAPRSVGGLWLSSSTIGGVLAVAGACIVPGQLVLYAPLERRLGPVQILRYGAAIEAPLMAVMPLATRLRGRRPIAFFAWLGLTKIFRAFVSEFVFTSNGIVSNNAVPDAQRGAYLGVQGAISALGRIVGPNVASPLFAWSVAAPRPFPLNYWCAFLMVSVELVAAFVVAAAMPRSLDRPIPEETEPRLLVVSEEDSTDEAAPRRRSSSGKQKTPPRAASRSPRWDEVPKLKRSRSPHPYQAAGLPPPREDPPPVPVVPNVVVQLVPQQQQQQQPKAIIP